jgi:membrane associated rhomboid family serine protease
MQQRQPSSLATALGSQVIILASVVVVLWGVEIVDQVFLRQGLDRLGIRPRDVAGLWGILFAPFLHGGFYHLLSNTVPLLVLGWLVLLRRLGDFVEVSLIALVVSGGGTWLVGRTNTVHIGASGVIFGYLGYLLFRGYFERSFRAIALSMVVAIAYGGMVWGVLPSNPYISWEGHLFGFVGGILAAKLLAEPKV